MIIDICPLCNRPLYLNKSGNYVCRTGNISHYQICFWSKKFSRLFLAEKYKKPSEFSHSTLMIYKELPYTKYKENVYLTKFYRYKFEKSKSTYNPNTYYNKYKELKFSLNWLEIKLNLYSKQNLSQFIESLDSLAIFK